MAAPGSPTTLADRILVHLRRHPIAPDAADVPAEVTQDGMADALGAQVAHVSRALKTLGARGLVTAHLAHPRGARRRSRAYALTDEGRARALALPEAAAAPAPPAATRAPLHGVEATRVPAGRERELAELLDALARARRGPTVALVEGESGIGKSSLLAAFAREAAERGDARVCAATGAPTGDEQVLGPVAVALAPLGFDRRFRALVAGTPRERALLAAVETLEAASRAQTVALVLDDLHLAGPSVVAFVHGLVLALPATARVLVVVAFRKEEAWELPNGPLYAALVPLRDMPGARHVDLRPLDIDGTAALLEDAGAPRLPPALVERVWRESGGNPLYAIRMAEALADGVDEEDFFPKEVRALATQRFAGLSAAAHAALQAAAVCGADFAYELLARVHTGPEEELVAALDVLLDRLLLEEMPRGGDDELWLRFVHPKVREAVLEQTSQPRRRLLEGRLARAQPA